MNTQVSARHTALLNDYKAREGYLYQWFKDRHADLELTDWAPGRLSMIWHVDDRFIFPDGFSFGGQIAFVGDHITSLVTMTALDNEDGRFRTSRLETNFFRPLAKCAARVEGRVVNVSKNLVHVEADIFNQEDKCAVRFTAVQMRRKASA